MKKNYLSLGSKVKLKHNFYLILFLIFFTSLITNISNAQCTPTGMVNWNGSRISQVLIDGDISTNEINNPNTTDTYTDYTAQIVTMTAGNTYNFSVTVDKETWADVKIRMWIDYAGNGTYVQVHDSGGFTNNNNVTQTFTGAITINPAALTSSVVLRVAASFCSTCGNPGVMSTDGCAFNNPSRADVEDYTINISGATLSDPIANDDDITVEKNSTAGAANQINVGANDNIGSDGSDGEDFTLTSVSPTANGGTITEITDGIFEYIPATGFIGADTFTYDICDALGDCATGTVNISVGLPSCELTSNSSGTHYITNVNLVGEATTAINNTSGDDGGYGNYIGTPAVDLYRGNTYPIELTVSTDMATENRSGWTVYIDLNGDGDFDYPSEAVYDTAGEDNTLSSSDFTFDPGSLTIPATAALGKTIMRIGARRYWSSTESCGHTGNPEEFEDYIVDIKVDPSTPQDIDITGNGTGITNGSIITTTDNYTDFGFYDINSGALQRTFIITNNGFTSLTLSALPDFVNIVGDAVFTVFDQPDNAVIAPGNSETFTISFNPNSVGNFSATISIGSDDPDENPFTFLVEGEGAQTFPDTDGDGITDNLDGDDDNDGILDSNESSSCATYPYASQAELFFLEEDFGSGANRIQINGNTPGVTTTYCYEDGFGSCPSAFNGTSINDGDYTVHHIITNDDDIADGINIDIAQWAEDYWYAGEDHTPGDTNGRMAIFNATADPGVFYSQIIYGLTGNVLTEFGFSALNIDRDDIDPTELATRERPDIIIRVFDPNGIEVTNASSGPLEPTSPAGDWVSVTASFTSPYTQFTIEVSNANLGGLGNDLAIDDIYVKQTLCDLDGDGVADSIDLDNDNDGIPNIYELGFIDLDQDGTITNDAWIDTNNNGVHDLYDPFNGGTVIDITDPAYDNDGDGIPNHLDLDSDNDGIYDVFEFDGLGDGDVDGDGISEGNDIATSTDTDLDEFDGDGILGLYDTNDTDDDPDDNIESKDHGTNGYGPAIDSDSDGTPDFLDPYNDVTGEYDIDTTIYTSLDSDNDGVIDGNIDTDNDGILDPLDSSNGVFGAQRDLDGSYTLYFDGRNDYVSENVPVIDAWSSGTLMSWVLIAPGSSGQRRIVGQENFYLTINSDGTASSVAGGVTLTSTSILPEGIWVHIAASFNNPDGNFVLFINGEQEDSATATSISAGTTDLTIGRRPGVSGEENVLTSEYFEGQIDEVRVFNAGLSSDEVQKMVYQELDDTNSFVSGLIIPLNVSALTGSSLQRYYKMDAYNHDITSEKKGLSSGSKIYNIKNIYFQTAPLPYETSTDGDWSATTTWLHGDVWDITDETNNKDWSIVHVKNNITTSNRHGSLGLLVDSGVELEINNDVELYNTWYLNLDGVIDLQGESQLVQTQNSTLVAGVSGNLERDQQGTENTYTYNYWSSPVHTVNPNADIDGDESFSVVSVLRNGEDPLNPTAITFTSGYNGNNTTNPIQISNYWIWKFNNRLSDEYSEWQQVTSTGNLLVGEGYTMKGPGTGASDKNYVFEGTPNNGEILLPTTAGNDYLVGNPYPSAIDANEFLNDNTHLNGTLYFWEHYGGGSHRLKEYEGGYGMYTLSGGVPAVSHPSVASTGSATKTPRRYIPVSQGFFVTATSTGDTKFENDQRIFVTETGNTNSWFYKDSNTKKTSKNSNSVKKDERAKIRLDYKSPKGYTRQVLTTVDKNASMNYDWGYDGALNEDNAEDMFWKIDGNNFVIQGINAINENTVLPLTIKTENAGIIEINLASLENVDDNFEIYLKDNSNNTYHDLKQSTFIATVDGGEINDRFEVVFASNSLLDTQANLKESLGLFYNSSKSSIVISNPENLDINTLQGVNILGQNIFDKNLNTSDNKITIPVNLATGVYIFSIQTPNQKISKKIILKN
ncbi:GEVED domain-containing protein [Flaviramulus sp. BrNp1-15]|uniref:LamG-like jellyroll fold domain-containing protein n=1 Tax=Flaviramulus sp. BrNp1-15 TaxID=2916754 RepID=UPI001EE88A07|nr:LamG-like jellyroll fold domain-containing protein [Flaviramulus sp. BrNp1-15]ULC59607.1 GEVED domain-containing protein [Flaviramulus sp. BrNp1-15]